jgi:flavin reductase (DIM6/NTAB) family NADH-FMN oxidoreductase RutF
VITAMDKAGTPFGLTMSSVTSLSLEPPLYLICVDLKSTTLPAIQESGRFCINFLSKAQQEISDVFASKRTDKFSRIPTRRRASGHIEIVGSLAVITCTVKDMLPGGDHWIITGHATEMHGTDGEPLVHFRGAYREMGPPQAGAATKVHQPAS